MGNTAPVAKSLQELAVLFSQARDADFTRHLTTLELAMRWNMSPRSLERWRHLGQGPRYIPLPRKVVYRVADVEAYERERLKESPPVGVADDMASDIDEAPREQGDT